MGKYLGLVLTIAINIVVMAAVWYAVLGVMWWTASVEARAGWDGSPIDPRMLVAVYLMFAQLMLVIAIALFFSTFSTPMLSAALTFGLFVAGRFSADLRDFNQVVESPATGMLTKLLYWILPNLAPFDVRAQVVHGQAVTAGYLALTIAYGIVYASALLVAASYVFSKRDFK